MFIYKVEKGDSLYQIAKKYNTTVKQIIDINNLKTTDLSIGQKIRIPEQYTEGELILPEFINYTVKKGDSLYNIAKEYNVKVDDIIKDNSLKNYNLTVGQNLKIRIPSDSNTIIEECFGSDYIPANDDSNATNYTI